MKLPSCMDFEAAMASQEGAGLRLAASVSEILFGC